MRKNGDGSSMGGKAALGIAGLAAAAAGAYYLYGSKEGPARRKRMKSWMLRMKADVMDQLEELKELNRETYESIVDQVAKKYHGLKNADPAEVAELVKRMRSHWDDIRRDVHGTLNRPMRRTSMKATKKRAPRPRKRAPVA